MEGKCKWTIMEDHRPLNPEGGFIKKNEGDHYPCAIAA